MIKRIVWFSSHKKPEQNLENKETQEKQKKNKKIKRPMMWYIFEKEIVQGPQKQCSQVKNKNLENLENLENQENQEKQ